MKKVYLFICLILCSFFFVNAQDTLYKERFTTGSGWDLGYNDVLDSWTINSTYGCWDPPNTPDRNGGNYLHIMSDLMTGNCATAYYKSQNMSINADLTTNINTTGYAELTLNFWWLCQGSSNTYGSVWYSADGGSTWKQFTTRSKYNSQTSWLNENITINSSSYSDALNQTDLRLRFQWKNASSGSDPAFAVDDVVLIGSGSVCPNIGGAATPTPAAICANQTSSIALTGHNGTIQWQQSANGTSGWANVTGGTGATTASYTTATLSTATYYRAVVSAPTCPDQYSTTATVTITVPPSPNLSISVLPSDSICPGQQATFTATVTGAGNAPVYLWKVNGNDMGGGATFSSTTLADGDAVSYQVTSNATCASQTPVSATGIIISHRPTVTPTITISVLPSDSICPGGQADFTSNITNGGASPTYQWKVGGVDAGTGATFSSTSIANNAVVTCQLTSNAVCPSPAQVTSTGITIKHKTGVTPTIVVSALPSNSVCPGEQINFTAVITNGGTSPAYLWKIGSNNASTDPTFSSSSLANGASITCQLTSNAVCANPTSVTSSPPIVVTINALPGTTITVNGQTTICEGDSVELVAPAGQTYKWSTNATTASIMAKADDTYTVTVTNSDDCSAISQPAVITVNSVPAASITTSGDTLISSAATTYQWYFNDTLIDGATGQKHIPVKNGYYSVEVSDDNTCSNISDPMSYTITGLGMVATNGLSIYPNPLTAGNWQLMVTEQMIGSTVEIFDAGGRKVFQGNIKNIRSEINFDAQPGIYLLKVSANGENITRKLVRL